jgi:hypothetical protein
LKKRRCREMPRRRRHRSISSCIRQST